MSREYTQLSPPVSVIGGSDHAIGCFIDVTDRRYADSGKDKQGEGYVMEWSELFGFTTNLIGLTKEDLSNREIIIEKADAFALTLQ